MTTTDTDKTYTFVVMEKTSPLPPAYPRPLIYTIDLDNPHQDPEFLLGKARQKIAAIRHDELISGKVNPQVLAEIAEGMEIQFAFKGRQFAHFDWR